MFVIYIHVFVKIASITYVLSCWAVTLAILTLCCESVRQTGNQTSWCNKKQCLVKVIMTFRLFCILSKKALKRKKESERVCVCSKLEINRIVIRLHTYCRKRVNLMHSG